MPFRRPALALCLALLACGSPKQTMTFTPDNPFAAPSPLQYQAPAFDKIGNEHFQPALEEGMRVQLAEVGAIAGLDLVNQPELVASPDHALHVACAFWEWKGLNKHCDSGDYEAVTRRVSGGLLGLQDRKAWLDKVRRVLASPPAPENQPPPALVVAVQRALQKKGYTEIGAADGDIGPRSIAAITRFRLAQGLPAGLIDKKLFTALEISV
jgi:putative chitinase